jgi:hypothetical protein
VFENILFRPTERILSPDFKPAAAAGEFGTISVTVVYVFWTGKPESTDAGKPERKPSEIRSQANKKFMNTPATSTEAWMRRGLEVKLSGSASVEPSASGFSPKIFTKPPKGSQFNVNIVPFQENKDLALGGYPNPNSSTRIPTRFATKKCPSSWTITRMLKMMRKIMTVTVLFYLFADLLLLLGEHLFELAIDLIDELLEFILTARLLVISYLAFINII